MQVIYRSTSTPSVFACPPSMQDAAGGKCRSLPDVQPLARVLASIHNGLSRATSRLSLHSSLADDDCALLDLGSSTSLGCGDLREDTPSPATARQLADCHAMLALPRDRAVQIDASGRLLAVPDGAAEYLLLRQHGLAVASATHTAGVLRRGGFQPPGDGVSTVGGIADALARLGERTYHRALPAEVCAATAAAITESMARDSGHADPWHQFGLDLARNPYTLDGRPETALTAFQQALHPLPPLQQRLAQELHQGLLAPLEAWIFFGNVLHPGGALLRSDDARDPTAPRASTRYHLALGQQGDGDGRALLTVHHDRPLGSALPRTAGLDALPEQRTLTRDSAYHVTLRVRCSPTGTVTVTGEHAVRLRYPETMSPSASEPTGTGKQPTVDVHVHGLLTAAIMDLHAQALSRRPDAVALHLAAIDPDTGASGIVGLLALARMLDAQTGRQAVLGPELARFAFAELRRCAERARQHIDLPHLALLKQALLGTRGDGAAPLHGLPAHGHWQHARQELCVLLAALLYRSAEQSPVPALDALATRTERRERDRQLGQLIQAARAGRWPELTALLPSERFGMWRTTRVQRPAACAFQHGDSAGYLEVALRCLNALDPRVATLSPPVRTGRSAPSRPASLR